MVEALVSVIIPTRDRKADVIDCLKSLADSNYQNYEVILVDNASTDGTAEAVCQRFPEIKIVGSERNLGIAGGRNLGQKFAEGDYLLFLDSDTVVDRDLLKELIELAQNDPKIGIVVPKMYFYDDPNRLWYAGATINLLTSRTRNIGVGEQDYGQYDEICEASHGPTAFLVRREVVEVIGGHEELYFMSYADADFALRAKRVGYKVVYTPKAKLWHKLSVSENRSIRGLAGTFPFRAYYFARNRVIFMKRNAPKLNFLIFLFVFFPLFTLYFSYMMLIFRRFDYLKQHLRGTWDGFKYALGGKARNPLS